MPKLNNHSLLNTLASLYNLYFLYNLPPYDSPAFLYYSPLCDSSPPDNAYNLYNLYKLFPSYDFLEIGNLKYLEDKEEKL